MISASDRRHLGGRVNVLARSMAERVVLSIRSQPAQLIFANSGQGRGVIVFGKGLHIYIYIYEKEQEIN